MQVNRCFDLGIIADQDKARLFACIGKRGWRRREPGDNTLPCESPRLFKQCIDAMLQEGFKTKQQIVDDLQRPAKDIEEICCLPDGYLSDGFGEIIKLASFKSNAQPSEEPEKRADIIPFIA